MKKALLAFLGMAALVLHLQPLTHAHVHGTLSQWSEGGIPGDDGTSRLRWHPTSKNGTIVLP